MTGGLERLDLAAVNRDDLAELSEVAGGRVFEDAYAIFADNVADLEARGRGLLDGRLADARPKAAGWEERALFEGFGS